MILNTENPLAPTKMKKKHIKDKLFAENYSKRTRMGLMNLWHITPPDVADIHSIKKRMINKLYRDKHLSSLES
jgi:hypothetical protein